LIEAGRAGWTSPKVLTGFGVALGLTAAFAVVERRSDSPVLPRHLFAQRAFSVCVAAGVVMSFGAYGTLFVESLRLQNVHHLSALATGLMMVPFTLAPTLTTRAIDRFDGAMHFKPRLFIGQLAAVAGSAALVLALWLGGYAVIELGLALLGISIGYITPAMTTGVLASSPAETSGVASGILNAGRQVGSSLGVALMGTFVQTLGERGSLVSFLVMLLLFAGMAAIVARGIPGPERV